jgi:hypothetical protein
MSRIQRRRERSRTLRSGEISADLRSARRSAISASGSAFASPAPLESKVPAGSGRIGGDRGGEGTEGVGETHREQRLRGVGELLARRGCADRGLHTHAADARRCRVIGPGPSSGLVCPVSGLGSIGSYNCRKKKRQL